MTRSETAPSPGDILDEIVDLLDEDRMRREIDDRVDWAVVQFRYDRERSFSAAFFHQVIGDLVGLIYEHGLRLSRRLSSSQARAEAMSLLERHYQAKHHRGYDVALQDAADVQHNGIEIVLVWLAQAIKAAERDRYAKWVFAERLGSCDWNTRLDIVRTLLDRYGPWLPPRLRSCAPAQLVDQIPAMIINNVVTSHQLFQMIGPPSFTSTR